MAEEKEYGLLIAAIVAIVSIVGLVILFSRGAPVGKAVSFSGGPGVFQTLPYGERGEIQGRLCQDDSGCQTGKRCYSGGEWKCESPDWSRSPASTIPTDRGEFQ